MRRRLFVRESLRPRDHVLALESDESRNHSHDAREQERCSSSNGDGDKPGGQDVKITGQGESSIRSITRLLLHAFSFTCLYLIR
jgi:hypothetical protein